MKKSGNSRQGQTGLTSHQLSELLEKEDLESFKKFLDTNGLGSQSAAQLLRQLCDKSCKCMHEFQKISLLLEYLEMRNPFFFDKSPEDCPVVKAFDANKQEIFKFLMKKPTKPNNQQFELIAQNLLFLAIHKYDKQKNICQHLFKTLREVNSKGIVNRQKDGLLLLNEAILKRDPSLVNDILNLNPNATYKDHAGISAMELVQNQDCPHEIRKMIMEYINGDKRRSGGGNYDSKDVYGSINTGQQFSGGYNKKGDFKLGEEPTSPSRGNPHSSNGTGYNDPNSSRRRKDNMNTVIVGSQQGPMPLSLTASGAHQSQKDRAKGNKQSVKGDTSGTNTQQSARGQPQANPAQPGSAHQQEYHKKGTSGQGKDDSKKIVGYVPENYKLTHMKEGSKRGTKKGSRNQGYGNQGYDDRHDPEHEGSSYGRGVYPGEQYEGKSKGGHTPSQAESAYGYYGDKGSQRGAKSKYDQQQPLQSRGYDPKDKDSRYGHPEGEEGQYSKMDRQGYYSSKGGADLGEGSHKGHISQNYVYNQQDFSKAGHISASGSKKSSKMIDETNPHYRNKGMYPAGSSKKDIEVDNIMVGPSPQNYYGHQYPHGGPTMNPSHGKFKTQQGGFKKYMDLGQGGSNEIMDVVSDASEQEKLSQLMEMHRAGEGGMYDPYEQKRRVQGKYNYPQHYDYNPGKPEHEPSNPERPARDKEGASKSSKESIHNKVAELEKLLKEREQILKSLTTKEHEMLEEKARGEQELNRLQNYFENKDKLDHSSGNCERCGLVFNMSNHISKSHLLDLGLHKEIISFEKTIMEINEREKPILDELIQKIEEIVKEVYPDSVVGLAKQDSNLRLIRHWSMSTLV